MRAGRGYFIEFRSKFRDRKLTVLARRRWSWVVATRAALGSPLPPLVLASRLPAAGAGSGDGSGE